MIVQKHETKLALGSDVTLMIVADANDGMFDELFRSLWSAIYQFERRFSRFIPNSELSSFNRRAGAKVPISQEFKDILETARRLGLETEGLYNPFILPALQRAGYTHSFVDKYKDDVQDDYSKRVVAAVDQLEIGDSWARIPHGTAVDLGGCGKGYLADLLADTIMPDWVQGYWLSLGGDVIGKGYDTVKQPWTVAIDDAFSESASKWFLQSDGSRFAVATSGTKVRTGVHQNKNWHHIIDPHTLQPSETDLVMATAFGTSAVDADVLASCAIILGSQKALPYLKGRGVTAAYLQGESNGKIERHFGTALKQSGIMSNKENVHA